jgi:hypothetical protein
VLLSFIPCRAAGKRTHRAARARRRAALAAIMRAWASVVMLRSSWLQLSDQAGASLLVCVMHRCSDGCPLLQRLQHTSQDCGNLVSGNKLQRARHTAVNPYAVRQRSLTRC